MTIVRHPTKAVGLKAQIQDLVDRCTGDEADKQLWAVLTALRGPDIGFVTVDDSIKNVTTAAIRGLVCPDAAHPVGAVVTEVVPVEPKNTVYICNDEFWHFRLHYRLARNALFELGYLEDAPNKKVKKPRTRRTRK